MLFLRRAVTRRPAAPARMMAVSAAAVKALAAEQKALSAALDALGSTPKYDQVKALIDSDPTFKATLEKVKAEDLSWTWSMLESAPTKPPVTVAVAGAGSAVGAATLFRIAAGEMLGLDQPIALQLSGADAAVTKELEACGFPLLKSVSSAASPAAALSGASYAILLEGDMKAAGAAIGADTLAGVVGLTNALAASTASGGKGSVTAITRPAQMAAEGELAAAAGVDPASVKHVIAWGTGIADVSHSIVGGKWGFKDGGNPLPAVSDPSSAVSADAVVAHMRDWATGSDGKWVSMGVPAVGDYGMGSGLFYSVPVVCTPGEYKRVGGVTLTPAVAEAMEKDRLALLAEKKAAGL